MQLVIFNFKTKTVTVAGTPAADRSLADVIAAQRKIIATSSSTATQATTT